MAVAKKRKKYGSSIVRVILSEEMKQALMAHSHHTGLSLSSLCRVAIAEALRQEKFTVRLNQKRPTPPVGGRPKKAKPFGG